MEAAKAVFRILPADQRRAYRKLIWTRTSVILTSDHGNIEDLSSRNHTLNAVPTIVWGANQQHIAGRIKNLADITPAIVRNV